MFRKSLVASVLFILFSFVLSSQSAFAQSKIWVGSWSCAIYEAGSSNTPPAPYIANNTLRQVVRVSIGGDTLRVKFSNKTCGSALTINSVNIAVSTGGSTINTATMKQLTFNGSSSVTMNPYSSTTSDPLAYALEPNTKLAITIFYGQAASNADIASHNGSRTDSYILTGDATASADFAGSVVTSHWYTINSIDVKAAKTAGSIGVLGNSITDGYGISGGTQNRWTDMLSQKLLNNTATQDVGVLNLGIGATNVAGNGATTGAARYKQDILTQSGLRWMVIFYGTNDINGGASASTITSAYQKMIDDAHAMNVKVYGATITPFFNNGYYTVAHEAVRNEVNNWIKAPGHFDAFIDFDKTIQDPANTIKMLDMYANDYLHPNILGYKLLGESVDTMLFQERTAMAATTANAGVDKTEVVEGTATNKSIRLDGTGSYDFGDMMASYTWKEGNTIIATGANPSVDLSIGVHTITLHVVGSNGDTATDDVVITLIKDTGIWLEAEAGTVGSNWDVLTDATASNSSYVTSKAGIQSTGSAPDVNGQLSFTFNAEVSGKYTVWARVICPSFDDDSFWMKMDGGSFAMWNGLAASSSWVWKSWTTTYDLTVGEHTFSIGYREDGAKLDKILITNSSLAPSGMGSTASNTTALSQENVEKITMYPNPVTSLLSLSLNNSNSDVSIYTIGGQKLLSQKTATTNISLNMASCLPGIYLVKISDKDGSNVLRVIKE